MKRLEELNKFKKILLCIYVLMPLIFTIIYSVTMRHEGYNYYGYILEPTYNGEDVIYEGKIKGYDVTVNVIDHKEVYFKYDTIVYGPYTATKDSSFLSKEDQALGNHPKGWQVSYDGEVLFEGAVVTNDEGITLYSNRDDGFDMHVVVDEVSVVPKPSSKIIIDLCNEPILTHRGDMKVLIMGIIICLILIFTILFTDELFYWEMYFIVDHPEDVSPSDFRVITWYLTWIFFVFIVFGLFVGGLML